MIPVAWQVQPLEIRVEFKERTAVLNDEASTPSSCLELLRQESYSQVLCFTPYPWKRECAVCGEVWGSISSLWSTHAKSLLEIIVLSPCVIFAQV